MRLGLFMMPLHPPQRPLHETLDENVEKAILADELGYDQLWVGQHFSATSEPIPAPLMFMAALLSRTKRIKLGTGVINLPNLHPAVVAAEVAQFDHMSKGRLMFGIGPGGLASDFELFGNEDAAVRTEKMMESLETILKIWASDPPYKHEGKHWRFEIAKNVFPELGVGAMPKPYQMPHPPLSVTAMSPASNTVKIAAIKGWSALSANFIPTWSIASHFKKWVEGCTASDRPSNADQWSVARNVFVADSDAEAEDHVFDPNSSYSLYFTHMVTLLKCRGYVSIMKDDQQIADVDFTPEIAMKSMVIHGSPKTVTEKLVAFREAAGPFGTLLTATMDWSGHNRERELKSMRLLAKNVMPHFDGA